MCNWLLVQDQDALKQLNTINLSKSFCLLYRFYHLNITAYQYCHYQYLHKNGKVPKQYKYPCKNETIFLTIAEIPTSGADFNDIHTTQPFSK